MGGNSSKNRGGGAGAVDSAATGVNSEAGTQADSHADSAGLDAGGTVSSTHSGGAAGEGAGAVGVGPVELVGSPDRLIAEAEAAAAGVPNVDPASGQVADLNPNGQWNALTPPAVEVLCAVVLPAWQIQPAEQRPVSEALAECLEQVFPGGIEGKYACWVRLIVACGAITVSRVATNGGKLPPLFLPNPSRVPPAPAPAPAANGHDPMTLTSLTP